MTEILRNRDMLLAVEHVRHRRGPPRLVGLEAPQRCAGEGVGGHQPAAILTEDNEPAGLIIG